MLLILALFYDQGRINHAWREVFGNNLISVKLFFCPKFSGKKQIFCSESVSLYTEVYSWRNAVRLLFSRRV